MTQALICGKDRRALQPCDVKRLRGRDYAGRNPLAALACRSKWRVTHARLGQIAMHLIAKHRHAVLLAQLADTSKVIPTKGAADRIVRVAKDKKRRLRIGEFSLQIRPIDAIIAVSVGKLVFYRHAGDVFDAVVKAIINGAHQQHVFGGRGELTDDRIDRRQCAASIDQPLLLDFIIVAGEPPALIRATPLIIDNRIAQNPLI